MNLQTAKGRVEKLRASRTKKNVLFGSGVGDVAGASAVIFALAGMGAAAVQTSSNASAAEGDDVDVYAFELSGTTYAGVSRQASFKNGDEIEVVYETKAQGHEVMGIRRPATRSIWMPPYMSCGSQAAIFRGIKMWLAWGLAGLIFGLLSIGVASLVKGSWTLSLTELICGYAIGLAALLLAGSWMLPRLYRFTKAADEVFAAFGFKNPKMLNLHKTSKAHRKTTRMVWTAQSDGELWY